MSVPLSFFAEALVGTIAGKELFPRALEYVGSPVGAAGVEYYAEVHKSKFNSLIHLIFMQTTFRGMNIWVPALLNLGQKNADRARRIVAFAYVAHYASIDARAAFLSILLYYSSVVDASADYRRIKGSNFKRFVVGVAVSTCSLLVQESVGHYLGGDDPSRMDVKSISNAIVYAKYFTADFVLKLVEDNWC